MKAITARLRKFIVPSEDEPNPTEGEVPASPDEQMLVSTRFKVLRTAHAVQHAAQAVQAVISNEMEE